MATEVVMPKLGLTMETGTLGVWLIEEGNSVTKGEPLLEVVTDKVTMEVEAQVDGILRKQLYPAGVDVEVTKVIGIIADADEDISALLEAAESAAGAPVAIPATPAAAAAAAPPAVPAAAPPPSPAPTTSTVSDNGKRHKASPKARKMLADQGLTADQVKGRGPGGRVLSADVEAYLASSPQIAPAAGGGAAATPAPAALVELTRPQKVAAERLTFSSREVPHIHLTMDVSAVWLQKLREGFKIEGKRISHNDMIVRATGRALSDFPRLNSMLEGDDQVRQFAQVDIGVAVDTPQGLLVPVIHDVPGKSLEEIAADSARLVDAARRSELQPDDLVGGTFTISNLGMFGVAHFTAIINPPQVAILAVGAIENRVVAMDNNALVAQPRLTLTLAADHRVVDGALGARFLQRLREVLETPGLLG